jgi:nucleoside-diphosphate-sugar epimerase
MKGKRALVTGGSGFIGSHLIRRLLDEGATVCALVRNRNPICNERLRGCWYDIKLIEADIRNRGALKEIDNFAPEYVFHMAAYIHVGDSFRQVEECFDVNAKGTANVIDVCQGAQKIVYMSSSEVYGHQAGVPFSEEMCPEPISPYAITKYAGELYCRMKQRTAGAARVVVLRPFNTFGPYQSPKAIIPELIINALSGRKIRTTPGEQTREFNYVSNIVDGLILAAKCDKEVVGPVNLGSNREIRIRDLVGKIVELAGARENWEPGALPYRPTEIWRMCAANAKAREVLGWRPAVDFEQGIELTVDWYRKYLRDGRLAASPE